MRVRVVFHQVRLKYIYIYIYPELEVGSFCGEGAAREGRINTVARKC